MISFLVFLVLFTASIIIFPVILTGLGFNVDPWILNAIAAFIGSLVAITGSVIITLITDKRKRAKAYSRELNLLKLELYNNFILAINKITNKTEVEYSIKTYTNFVQFLSATEDKKYSDIIKELQVLYFMICNGDKLLSNYDDFYNQVLIKEHKKPDNIMDVIEIIQSKNIDNIFEFSLIQNIILLNDNFHLNIDIPYEAYNKLLDSYDNTMSLYERISFYLAEQVCKYLFKDNTKVYFLDVLMKGNN